MGGDGHTHHWANKYQKHMNTNPNQTQPEERVGSNARTTPSPLGFSQHIAAMAIIAAVSYVIAMLVTPADPVSMIAAAIPTFVIIFSAYLLGFRNGRKRINDKPSDRE